jgi:diguanylate cyclase (GGDEF)-like protein
MSEHSWRRAARQAAIVLIVFAGVSQLAAVERGFPVITVYPAEVHLAGPQNFDIAQDSRGILYFGNLHGLVSFDGAWWRLRKLPDEQVALTVAADDRGTVALGLVNDFGILTSGNEKGESDYRSLRSLVPKERQDFGDVFSICTTGSGFLFLTERGLMLWEGKTIRVGPELDAAESPRDCLEQGDSVLLRGPKGVQRFHPRTFEIEPTTLDDRVTVLVEWDDRRAIAAVRDGGLVMIEGLQSQPFSPQASEWLKGKLASGGALLPDGRLVITTQQNGLIVIDRNGEIEQVIGADAGLPDSTINEAMVDREGALWLAMEGPIARIDMAAPVTLFDVRRGVRGSVGDVARHAGRLYTATTHGLFAIDSEGNATRLPGLREGAWRLLRIDDELLVGSAAGIYRVDARGELHLVKDLDSEIYDLRRAANDPSRVWVAQGNGIGILTRTSEGWQHDGMLPGVPQDASSMVEHGGVLWAGSVFDGILRISEPYSTTPRVTQFGSGEMNVYLINGQPAFVRATGQFLAIDARGELVPHPQLGHIKTPRGFFIALEDPRGGFWINSTPPRYFNRLANGRYPDEGRALVSVTAADIQAMRTTADGVIWFASDKGLFRYEPDEASQEIAQAAPLIRRIVAGENQLLYGGAGSAPDREELRHRFGRMRIEFAPASYRPGVEYQYRLDPVDQAWSDWTTQTFIDYTTLEPGAYTFHLRARGAGTTPSPIVVWTFSVLPPWYRTAWAWMLWVVLAGALVIGFNRIRTRSLRRQAARLKTIVAEQTAELKQTVKLLEDANARLETLSLEDDLTGIANRRSFERSLQDEWNRARRREHPVALILLDLDHFKDLNDRRGHPAGDDCLRRIGAFLSQTIRRSGEVVARYGGEEFAILLPGVETPAAIRIAESLREGIEELNIPYGPSSAARVTASCGVASIVPVEGTAAESLVVWADRALYAAKHSGRNCVRVADETLSGKWLHDATA